MIRIGTSGWTYGHWKGSFYPMDLARKKWLEFYSERFDTVELNASFYHIPKSNTTQGWKERTPESFLFSIKVTRLITHVRKLKECDDIIRWFFGEMEPLKTKVFIYLLQFPPSYSPSEKTLRDFLTRLPKENRYALEFRNKDSYSRSIQEIMEEHGTGFCIHDYPGRDTPHLTTSDVVYVRFHGFRTRYAGSYPNDTLKEWACRLIEWEREEKKIVVYFNNDMDASAVKNAITLRKLIQEAG